MTDRVKPHQVVIAGRFMWTLWALGGALLLLALGIGIAHSQPGVASRVVMSAIALSLTGLLIRFVLMGRNWARILYALLACVAIAAQGLGLVLRPRVTWIVLALSIAMIAAYAVVLRLLFHRSSTPWFRRDGQSST